MPATSVMDPSGEADDVEGDEAASGATLARTRGGDGDWEGMAADYGGRSVRPGNSPCQCAGSIPTTVIWTSTLSALNRTLSPVFTLSSKATFLMRLLARLGECVAFFVLVLRYAGLACRSSRARACNCSKAR